MHDCHLSDAAYRMFYLKTNHRRGGFIEDIRMENVTGKSVRTVFEIDTDVLYQWRDIVPTFETAITRIRNISLIGAECEQADAVYRINGDSRDPVQGVLLKDVHIGKVNKYINESTNCRNVVTDNVVWDSFDASGTEFLLNGFAPGI